MNRKLKKISNHLYIQNSTRMDVGVDDLFMVVKSGTTIDVYRYNPALTVEQVQKSLESGSLSRRIKGNMIRIVNKIVATRPVSLDDVKLSDKPRMIKQTKSTIIVEPSSVLDEGSKEAFDFADFGVNLDEIKKIVPEPKKNTDGSVTVGPGQPTARSLVAIKRGDDAVDNVYTADKAIHIETKVLDENGEETDTEAVMTDEKAIVMQTAPEGENEG